MEKQLVSFGNYLLKSAIDRPENVRHSVTHADLRNWEHESGETARPEWGTPDIAKGAALQLDLGKIESVKALTFHSFGDKHKYDIELKLVLNIDGAEVPYTTRLYSVDRMLLKEV